MCKFEKLASETTRTEFINNFHFEGGMNECHLRSNDGNHACECPTDEGRCSMKKDCVECWNNAVVEMKFKGEQ